MVVILIKKQATNYLHINGVNWNLNKETLQEQTEETQRNINQLLKHKHENRN